MQVGFKGEGRGTEALEGRPLEGGPWREVNAIFSRGRETLNSKIASDTVHSSQYNIVSSA